MKKIFYSKQGFSIVEIMVALGLLAVIALVVMKISDNANKASKDIQTKDDILQFQHELNQILSSATNCEVNLGGARRGQTVFGTGVSHLVQGNSILKYPAVTDIRIQQTQTHISRARILNVDLNSSIGNNAIVDLEVTFRKPDNRNRIGAVEVNRVIKLGASLCRRDFITAPDMNGVRLNCNGQNQQLVEGPHDVSTPTVSLFWAQCEDCNIDRDRNSPVTPNSPIMSCHALSAGSGVNLDNLTRMQCLNMGGSWVTNQGVDSCDMQRNNQVLDITFDQQSCERVGGIGNWFNTCHYRWIDLTDSSINPNLPIIRVEGGLPDDNNSVGVQNNCENRYKTCPDAASLSGRNQCSKVLVFETWDCVDSTDVGVGFRNLCYYHFECANRPGVRVGSRIIQEGRTTCNQNDCSTKVRCENRRIPCLGGR